ncbi:hypothetical protein [Crossiella sp. CA198]|uniref:hypothetical protein n=1 Tax=Crossiella sp. CA198 TaxID=3455607 RepID=UPI003F8D5378
MAESLEDLERRIGDLRNAVRRAAMSGDRVRAGELRADLRKAEDAWGEAITALTEPAKEPAPSSTSGPMVSIRDQVHQALTVLGIPASPKLIVAVHGAFFAGELVGTQLTSLRRDEERSFRSSPHARPYYLCSALTADRLVPARGLLAVSTWPLTQRVIGPLSPRVDFLTAAIRLADQVSRIAEPTLPAQRLLWQFAANIPGATTTFEAMVPAKVADAAKSELTIHHEADHAHRAAAASRGRTQLDEIHQLFGSALKLVHRTKNDA